MTGERTLLRPLALLVALAWLAVGCGAGDDSAADAGSPGNPAPAPGFDGDTIRLGALSPLSDAVAVIGIPVTGGQEVYFQALNEERGGVAGRYPVELVVQDINYANPSTTVQQYNRIKDDIVALAQVLGTDHVNTLLPLLETDGLIAVPATLDAEWVRQPHLLPLAAPYQILAINAMDYYVNQAGGREATICSMVFATGYGEAGQQGLEFAASEMGFEIATTATFRPGDQEFVAQVTQLRNAGCEAVLLVSLPSETGRILGTAAQLGFAPRWIALSPAWLGVLAQSPVAGYMAEHLWVAIEAAGEWGDTTVAGMREMMEDVRRYRPDQQADFYFIYGYSLARAVHAVVEKAVELGDLSRGGVRQAMIELGTVSFGDLLGDYRYGPVAERDPPRASSLFGVNPEMPYGLEAIAVGIESPAARAFTFE